MELGKKVGIVGKQISNYEKGKPIPPIDVMLKLCDVFQCELGYLLGEPDYSEGTKLETAIIEKTGLNKDSLISICKITGTEKSCLNFGYKSDSYRSILNSLFSSPQFINFIECLHDLDTAVSESKKLFTELENKLGKERLDEAFAFYNSTIDYEHDPNAPKLKPEQYKAMGMIDSTIDKQYSLSYTIKIARYELHEAFESLVESLYPREE
ncbi:MAG: helix-turn-helix domain-containing protein [Lachnospiraceae bacterium]|nr:helix-turn-helix domain-containing protein [Lachnospiraceae bacterium]